MCLPELLDGILSMPGIIIHTIRKTCPTELLMAASRPISSKHYISWLRVLFCLAIPCASFTGRTAVGQLETAGTFRFTDGISQQGSWDARFGQTGPGIVRHMQVVGNTVYASDGQGLWQWNQETRTWSRVENFVYGTIRDIVVHEADVYFGGYFLRSDGLRHVARWNRDTDTWHSLGAGVDGSISAMTAGENQSIFIAGDFENAGDLEVNRIAKWSQDSESWEALGPGIDGYVHDLAFVSGQLYAVGHFSSGDYESVLSVWSGNQWTVLAESNGDLQTLSVTDNGVVFVGGCYDHLRVYGAPGALDLDVKNLTKLENGVWNSVPIDTGFDDWCLADVDAQSSGLIVAVEPTRGQGGGGPYGVAKIIQVSDGKSMEIASLIRGAVDDIHVTDTEIFAGGWHSVVDGVASPGVAVFNRTTGKWTGLNHAGMNGASSFVFEIEATSENSVYVGGRFRALGTTTANSIGVWTGNSWQNLGLGLDANRYADVYSIALLDDKLYVGGSFSLAGTSDANNIAVWDTSLERWESMGSGIDDPVYSISLVGGSVFATSQDQVFQYFDGRWEIVGKATLGQYDGYFTSTAVSSSGHLVVTGDFLEINSTPARNVATFLDGQWSEIGGGLPGPSILEAANGNLYAAGSFNAPSGHSQLAILYRDEESWSFVEGGLESSDPYCFVGANDIAVSKNYVYLGGGYTGCAKSGESNRRLVSKWDGTSWTSLGEGIYGDQVYALSTFGSNLYAGGDFLASGEYAASNFAHWIEPIGLSTQNSTPESRKVRITSYPNPATKKITILVELDNPGPVVIEIHDSLGRLVERLSQSYRVAGRHQITWLPTQVASGWYFCVVRGSATVASHPFLIL